MTMDRWIAIAAAFALLAFPTLSRADHHEDRGMDKEHHENKAGGVAAEHRSDKAAEKSNAQWDEDNEGRPEKPRGGDDADDDQAEMGKKAEKGKKDKMDKKDKKDKMGKKGEMEEEDESESEAETD